MITETHTYTIYTAYRSLYGTSQWGFMWNTGNNWLQSWSNHLLTEHNLHGLCSQHIWTWTKTAGDKQNFSLQHHIFIHFPCEIKEKGTGTQKYLKDTQSCLHGLIYNWTNSQNVCCDILKWNILKERYIYQTLTTKNAKTHYLHSLLWSSGRHSYRWHCLETLQNIPHISKRRHHPLLFPLILLLIFP